VDALRSALPAGTLSGAPKVRAMEIIDELEPVKRGAYGGAVGWLSYVLVSVFQVLLFIRGINWIGRFLNFAGPAVYVVMIILMGVIWYLAGNNLFTELGDVLAGDGE
jgi:amino acid transporter